METKTRHLIMKLAEQYEKPEFVADDPVQFPRKFGYKCSQEIVGFIAAWLAYGNRDMMDIAHFLRQYDRANVKIDASPFDRHMINEQIFRL